MSDDSKRNPPYVTVVIKNTLSAAKESERIILDLVEKRGYRSDASFAIRLALEEALTNAIKHGNKSDPNKYLTIRYSIGPQDAIIYVADEGAGFAPGEVPDCTAPDRISLPDGRGIMLMKAYLDEVAYSKRGSEIKLLKRND